MTSTNNLALLANPYRRVGLPSLAMPPLTDNPDRVRALLKHCPIAHTTPLHDMPALAEAIDVGSVLLKDETTRMNLGSFKALGAAYVIAQAAAAVTTDDTSIAEALRGTTYVSSSAGNHGLSIAAGARLFGAKAVIYLSATVPEAFAERLRGYDAEVVRSGKDYEESMDAAMAAADKNGWVLLSDTSWPGYTDIPARIMEGYTITAAEVADALPTDADALPTHIFLQAGVGGLAAAAAVCLRARWGEAPIITVVEPDRAPALLESIRLGKAHRTTGAASIMGRLDCKDPSHLALAELARSADFFMTITDDESAATVAFLAQHGIATTPSGAAGFAAAQHAGEHRDILRLNGDSRVLSFISEGEETTA